MLTKKILSTRQANSVTVQCKFHIRLEDLAAGLNLSEQKINLADCHEQKMKETLLTNFEIVELVQSADEIVEFEVVAIGKEMQGKKLLEW